MTARERREREVQKMANRLDRMLAPYAQRHEIASVVLRLLAAERRKAAKLAGDECHRAMFKEFRPDQRHHRCFDLRRGEVIGRVERAILNGGRK